MLNTDCKAGPAFCHQNTRNLKLGRLFETDMNDMLGIKHNVFKKESNRMLRTVFEARPAF